MLREAYDWLRDEIRRDLEATAEKSAGDYARDLVETCLAIAIWYRLTTHVILFRALAGKDVPMRVEYHLTAAPQAGFAERPLTARQGFEIRLYSAGWWAILGLGMYVGQNGFEPGANPVLVGLVAANWLLLVADPVIGAGWRLASQVRESGSSPGGAVTNRGD
jgi:hypothetical protein